MSSPPRSLHVRIDLLGYWLAGTAAGDAATVDVAANRDECGLPYLPGRTLKGLLRHAAADLAQLPSGGDANVAVLFGYGDDAAGVSEGERISRYATRPGKLHVGSAQLPSDWRAWAVTSEGRQAVPHLFTTLSSTALDEDGIAKDHTLRTIEVAVPMSLEANLSGDLTDDEVAFLQRAARLVRGVGRSRTRGLGRARLRITEVSP